MKPNTAGKPLLRFRITLLFTLMVLPFLAGCGDGGGGTEPAPVATTVAVSPSSATLQAIGGTVQLSATVRDQNGQVMTGASVSWSSSDNGVATVSSGGLGTAVSAGSATLTATSGQASGTVSVTVTQVVTSVAVSPASYTIVAGEGTIQFTAAVKDANGHAVHGAMISWTSSDPSRMSVDAATGLATPWEPGPATITATSGGVSGTASVTVLPRPVATVQVEPSSGSILVGETLQMTASPRDGAGNVLVGRTVTWASSDMAVATVTSSGLVTGLKLGTSTITATSEGRSGQATVTVAPPPTPWTVTPENLGPRTATAGVRGVNSFASLNVFCDATVGFRWGLVVRDVGSVPFTTGVELTLIPAAAGDPAPSWGYVLGSLFVGQEAATELQGLIRARQTAVLVYPSGNPVVAITVQFDLRAAKEALEEIEAICRGS